MVTVGRMVKLRRVMGFVDMWIEIELTIGNACQCNITIQCENCKYI